MTTFFSFWPHVDLLRFQSPSLPVITNLTSAYQHIELMGNPWLSYSCFPPTTDHLFTLTKLWSDNYYLPIISLSAAVSYEITWYRSECSWHMSSRHIVGSSFRWIHMCIVRHRCWCTLLDHLRLNQPGHYMSCQYCLELYRPDSIRCSFESSRHEFTRSRWSNR